MKIAINQKIGGLISLIGHVKGGGVKMATISTAEYVWPYQIREDFRRQYRGIAFSKIEIILESQPTWSY